ncbi:MAG: hypothetical protein M1833_006829 [Piccolia ochrophora]|nr:MAG: hypothetical protein M1833_006829 [Piccolia ochrophora]
MADPTPSTKSQSELTPTEAAHVARGFKTTAHNPNVSAQARLNAQQQLAERFGASEEVLQQPEGERESDGGEVDRGNVERGLKAYVLLIPFSREGGGEGEGDVLMKVRAMSNPRVTEEGKRRAGEKLEGLEKGGSG